MKDKNPMSILMSILQTVNHLLPHYVSANDTATLHILTDVPTFAEQWSHDKVHFADFRYSDSDTKRWLPSGSKRIQMKKSRS